MSSERRPEIAETAMKLHRHTADLGHATAHPVSRRLQNIWLWLAAAWLAVIVAADRAARSERLHRWLAAAWLAVIVAFALLAPVLGFVNDPYDLTLEIKKGPSGSFWFGTDNLSRDVFARVVWGARLSLLIAFVSTLIGTVIGGVMGLVSGYFKGWIDDVIGSAINILLSLPALMFAMLIVTVMEQSLRNVIIAVSILSIPAVARVARAQTIRFADREFVTAAKGMGARHLRIVFREILPNILPVMMSFAFLAFGIVIISEGALSYIGKSVPSPSITWGAIIASGKNHLEDAPHIIIFPALVLFLTLLAVNYIGDRLLQRSGSRG